MPTHPVNISYTLINTPYLAIFFQFLVLEVEHFTSFILIIYLQEPDAAWNFEYSVGVGLSLRCVSVWVKVFESSSSRKSPGIYVSQNKALESSSLKEPPGIQVSQSSLPKGLFITSKLKHNLIDPQHYKNFINPESDLKFCKVYLCYLPIWHITKWKTKLGVYMLISTS